MTRPHDMGGRFGDGPVRPERGDAPVFAEPWHGRALALTLAAGALGQWNLDMSRHARERLAPTDYTRFSYYEKWLAALADLLVEQGVLTVSDLNEPGQGGQAPHALADRCLRAARVEPVLSAGGPSARVSDVPAIFARGQSVRTRRPGGSAVLPGGHTRLPQYASGARGRILRCHGAHVLPDMNAHGRGEAPEPLYSVIFPASELWSNPENPRDEVVLDLWQSYLDPA